MVNWEENTMFVLVCFCGWASISKTRAHNTYTIPPPSYNMYREKKKNRKRDSGNKETKVGIAFNFSFSFCKNEENQFIRFLKNNNNKKTNTTVQKFSGEQEWV